MLENYDELMLGFEEALTSKVDRLKYEYTIIRAGRANPRMLDKIYVSFYGTMPRFLAHLPLPSIIKAI